jgi:hypothetical protein
MAASALLVVVVGGSLALLARSGRASASRLPTKATSSGPSPAPASTAASPAPTHELVEGGAVLQSVAHSTSTSDHPVADSPASVAKRTAATERGSASPSRAQEATPAPLLPAGRLPNVKIAAVAGGISDLKIVPPELLVDERSRLANGQDQADQGNYAVARRTFRSAIAQLDSVTARYPDSQSIRTLRREIEQADTRAVQACAAENDMRKRRGEEARACQ